jgi:hypothetical protein
MRRTLIAALALGLAVACYHRRDVTRADWGAVSPTNVLTVRTLEGKSVELHRFQFTTTQLIGVRKAATANATPDSVFIPLDSIAAVRASQLDRSATLMLSAAAVTATFVLFSFTQSTFRPEPVPYPPASCPFVYSWDGSRYILDSETYSGAIARALERTDVDNLDHLRAVRGRYRLRMRNERPETEYTDELSLLVVDHPTGTRAIPDANGALRLIRDERPPLQSRDFGGDTLPARAGRDLTFSMPPTRSTDSLALVLRARNTPMAAFALGQVLDLFGAGVYGFYRSLNQPITRSTVRGWMDREGALEVRVGTDSSWTTICRVPEVGPMIAKTVVVLLPPDVRRDSLRLRLESSPGLWVIESATLATYAGTGAVRAISPVNARTADGQDVAALLAARDGRYYVALEGRDVDLEYDAPPLATGATRSVLLQSTGHYYIDSPDTARPRVDIVQRILMDRGYAQRYFADAWVRAGNAPIIPLK